MDRTVGVIGLGIMGSAMGASLVRAGFRVIGHDVLADRGEAFAAAGGEAAASAREVADACRVIITSLPSADALHTVCGADGIAAGAADATTVIETSTLPIADKAAARDALAASGVTLLDCPLSGTGAQAATGDLVVLGSGDKAAFDECAQVFEGFARSHYHLGEFGNGSRMKFIANLLVNIHNVAAAEAMVLGMKAGLDAQMIYDVIRDGAGNSRIFELRAPMMVTGDYDEASMKIDVWQKDLRIIGAFAAELGCPTPLFSAAVQPYLAAMAQGLAKQDTAAVCTVLEKLAGLERRG